MGVLCNYEKSKKNEIKTDNKYKNNKNKSTSSKIFDNLEVNFKNNKNKSISSKILDNFEGNFKDIKSNFILKNIIKI